MCGRFSLVATDTELNHAFNVTCLFLSVERYNIAPSQQIPIIIKDSHTQESIIKPALWGFIPGWMKDPERAHPVINARAETLNNKPYFRTAIHSQRCLIPASGFYEWMKAERNKQPFYIHSKNHKLFAFAGLWAHYPLDDFLTCAIITCEANSVLQPIHQRMPVIIDPTEYSIWLDPGTRKEDVLELLQPKEIPNLNTYPITTYVNSPDHEGHECIRPLGEQHERHCPEFKHLLVR